MKNGKWKNREGEKREYMKNMKENSTKKEKSYRIGKKENVEEKK
jgi:hypothetical protein